MICYVSPKTQHGHVAGHFSGKLRCCLLRKHQRIASGEACPRGRDVLDLAIVRALALAPKQVGGLAQTNQFRDLADPFSLAPGALERQNAGPPWQLRSLFDVTQSLISSYMAPLRNAEAHKPHSCRLNSHGAG